jgi:hypothetical protein
MKPSTKRTALVAAIVALSLNLTSVAYAAEINSPAIKQSPMNQTIAYDCDPRVDAPGVRIWCGAKEFVAEQYLIADNGTKAIQLQLPPLSKKGGGHRSTARRLDGSATCSWSLPVTKNHDALVLAWTSRGTVRIKAGGKSIEVTSPLNGPPVPREMSLTDSQAWKSGQLLVEAAAGSNGEAGEIFFLEAAPVSSWTRHISSVLWDTVKVVWSAGYLDGYGYEFRQTLRECDLMAGQDPLALTVSGTNTLHWLHSPQVGRRYALLVSVAAGTNKWYVGEKVRISISGQQPVEHSVESWRVRRLDISNLPAGRATVEVSIPGNAHLDALALVEIRPGAWDKPGPTVRFLGNEVARDLTRSAQATFYWAQALCFDRATGFLDTSAPRGRWNGQYYICDAGPMFYELARWGFLDQARQCTAYHGNDVAAYYQDDRGSSAWLALTIAHLMRGDGYRGSYTAVSLPRLTGICDHFVQSLSEKYFFLLQGNNKENGGGFNVYNTTLAWAALRAGADAAEALGDSQRAALYREKAALMANGMAERLIVKNQVLVEDWARHKGTVEPGEILFGLRWTGDPETIWAGWWTAGNHGELWHGLRMSPPEMVPLLAATARMMERHPKAYWQDRWRLYGSNYGFGTDYGCTSERAGRFLDTALLADRIDLATKNLCHLAWCATDANFTDGPQENVDVSPYAIPRAIASLDDSGIRGPMTGGSTEELNGIEHAIALRALRHVAGPDDGPGGPALVPRLPLGFDGMTLRRWPYEVKSSTGSWSRVWVDAEYRITPRQASCTVTADSSFSDLAVRLGPFWPGAQLTARVDGRTVAHRRQESGGWSWAWVNVDVAAVKPIQILLTVNDPTLIATQEDPGWQRSGDWSEVEDGRSQGRAPATLLRPEESASRIHCDIRLTSTNTVAALVLGQVTAELNHSQQKVILRTGGKILAEQAMNVRRERTYQLELQSEHNGRAIIKLDGVPLLEAMTEKPAGKVLSGINCISGECRVGRLLVRRDPSHQ